MKQLLLFTLILAVMIIGCKENNEHPTVLTTTGQRLDVAEIDGCEYLMCSTDCGRYVYTHKGNCHNPIHYNQNTCK